MFLISCICGIRFPFRIRAEDNSGTDLALYLSKKIKTSIFKVNRCLSNMVMFKENVYLKITLYAILMNGFAKTINAGICYPIKSNAVQKK